MKNIQWEWGQSQDDSNSYYGIWINELFYGMVEFDTLNKKKPKGFLWF